MNRHAEHREQNASEWEPPANAGGRVWFKCEQASELAIGNRRFAVPFALRCSTFVILWAVATANAQSGGAYVIRKSTMDSGGDRVVGGEFVLTGTVGQPDAAELTGSGYTLAGGFWSPADAA